MPNTPYMKPRTPSSSPSVAISPTANRFPTPSEPDPEQPAVTLSPLVTAKVALHNAMLERDMTKVTLARKLGVTETIVRRLLDLDHRSHIGQVELALEQLGYRLVTSVAKIA